MKISSDDYILLKEEWEMYHNFKLSLLQKIVWFFWPTETSVKYILYKDVEYEDCL